MTTRQQFDTMDQLRIVVERDKYPGELYNGVDSPSGAGGLGVWGWSSPTALTAIGETPGPQRLVFSSFADQAADVAFSSQAVDIDPGQWIKAQYLEYKPYAAGGPHRSRLVFFDAGGSVVSEGAWSDYWIHFADAPVLRTRGPIQAPANTAYARLVFGVYSPAKDEPGALPGFPTAGHRFDFGNVIVATANTAAGLADLTQAKAGYPAVEVTPETGEVNIVRTSLDVGTMTASLASDDLDPANTDALRPGRRIVVATAGGEPLFSSRIYTPRTDYSAVRVSKVAAGVITVTSNDIVSVLAATPCAQGYRFTDDLRGILDKAITPVPWSVNGEGGQTIELGADATDSGASLLDQVLRTRDTNHAFAWVDREGALRIFDRDSGPMVLQEPVDTLTEDDYSDDLAPVYDVEQVVNSVMVTNYVGGASVTHGPYRDFVSIRRWGERTATYSVVDIPNPATFAAEVLATNANPQVTVDTVTVALSTPDRVERFARLELCDLLTLTCAEPELDLVLRISSITHRITAKSWLMTLGLVLADRTPLPSI